MMLPKNTSNNRNVSRVLLVCAKKFASISANSVQINFGDKTMKLETGTLAKIADGSVLSSIGGTSVLATVVCKPKTIYGGFLPLTVDYRQKFAAANRIPTNYYRRDLGPSESEILTSRLIDRTLRPLFARGFVHDVQISCDTLSLDVVGGHDPRVAAANAAATALLLADAPWRYGPAACVRLAAGRDGTRCMVNPTRREADGADLDLILGATAGRRVIMLDGAARDVPDDVVVRCIETGLDHTERIIECMMELGQRIGKKPRESLTALFLPDEKLVNDVMLLAEMQLRQIFDDVSHDKLSRDKAVQNLREQVIQNIRSSSSGELGQSQPDVVAIDAAFNATFSRIFRSNFFKTSCRVDGRKFDELRPILCKSDLFAPLHGSALFQRGQTQVLSTLTLDSIEAALKNDAVSVFLGALKEKMFMLTYEFPPYANNELGISGGRLNRREIGHAALAEKALRSLMPDDFAFATRLACQVLESNGSSSMASVCAGSLALIDGGVPIKAPCAGVAMGMISEPFDDDATKLKRHCFLTDITGLEDYAGDMDLKVAGTCNGITAIQLDVKTPAGLNVEMLYDVVAQANLARRKIIDVMHKQVIDKSGRRTGLKPNGPVVQEFVVPVSKRFKMTRMASYNMRKLESDLGIQITRVDAQTYRIFAPNKDLLNEAKEEIDKMLDKSADQTTNFEFGAVCNCQVVEILESGVCVTLSPGSDSVFVPNSQLDVRSVKHPSALGIEIGQSLMFKYFGRDPVSGQIRLSRKVLLRTASESVVRENKSTTNDNGTLSPWAKEN